MAPATTPNARGRAVIELAGGITIYLPQDNEGRWRAVWIENGRRRYCEAETEAKLSSARSMQGL